MKREILGILMAAVMVLSIPAISNADFVEYINYNGENISYTYGTKTGGVAAEIYIKWNNIPTWAYCIDLDNYLSSSNTVAYLGGVGAPIAAIDFKEAAWLIQKNWAPALSSIERAALQAAIWNVRYNGAFVIGTTNGASFDGYYSTYMSSLSDPGFASFTPSNYAYLDLEQSLTNDTVQDLITRAPEPMTMILFGLGLVGLAGLRRKE